jgi:L-asparaginase
MNESAATPRRRVHIIHTGGTIGMVARADGAFTNEPSALANALAGLPELQHAELPSFTVEEFDPLLDSSDMRPADWQKLAEHVAMAFHLGAHGVVVLHGTDTMAYSASALAFLLENLPGPVVFTGSQLPLGVLRSDARENLINALLVAATPAWAEVALLMGAKLLRGCRATKVSTEGFDAFASPNLPPLAEIGTRVVWQRGLLRPPSREPLRVKRLTTVEVLALRLFPGITAETLRNVLRDPVRGVVLESYGSGNAPSRDPKLLAAIADACARGVVVVNVTQCLHGSVQMGTYATGRALEAAGVVPAFDMTAEAALSKLLVLLSHDGDPESVRSAMGRNLVGEVSEAP